MECWKKLFDKESAEAWGRRKCWNRIRYCLLRFLFQSGFPDSYRFELKSKVIWNCRRPLSSLSERGSLYNARRILLAKSNCPLLCFLSFLWRGNHGRSSSSPEERGFKYVYFPFCNSKVHNRFLQKMRPFKDAILERYPYSRCNWRIQVRLANVLVDLTGFEPATSSLRRKRSPNWAKGPTRNYYSQPAHLYKKRNARPIDALAIMDEKGETTSTASCQSEFENDFLSLSLPFFVQRKTLFGKPHISLQIQNQETVSWKTAAQFKTKKASFSP